MKQGTSKSRYGFAIFYTGLILGLTVLGACDGGLPSQEFQGTEYPAIRYNEEELGRVQVAVPQQRGARNSVNPGYADVFVELYEVVFKNKTGASYYRGTADAAQGYISVDVPVGKDYEVLLLGGRKNGILLGAGYVPVQHIEAGKTNMVSIMVSPAAPVWDGKAVPGTDNDFTFDGTGGIAGLVSVDELNRCVKAGSDTVTPGAGDTFSVTFNLAQLVPLIEAEGNALTLQGYTVQLLPRDGTGQGNFTPVPFTASGFTPGVPMASPTAITFTNTGDLPGDDVDGLLDFELTYHAFGAPASGGNKWLIRNGLTFAEDTQSNSGGRFIVQIGAGTL